MITRGLLLIFFFREKQAKTKNQNNPPNFKVMQMNPFTIFTVIFLCWKTNYTNRLLKSKSLSTGQRKQSSGTTWNKTAAHLPPAALLPRRSHAAQLCEVTSKSNKQQFLSSTQQGMRPANPNPEGSCCTGFIFISLTRLHRVVADGLACLPAHSKAITNRGQLAL